MMNKQNFTSEIANELLRSEIIKANAGSGKTYKLAQRYIAILACSNIEVQDILATTFTNKAASEIRERIFQRLAKAIIDKGEGDQLAIELDIAKHSDSEKKIFFNALLQKLLKAQNRINISTLDSFFIKIAKCFGLELGLPLDWNIQGNITGNALKVEALNSICEKVNVNGLKEISELLSGGKKKNIFKFIKTPNANNVREQNLISHENVHRIYRDTLTVNGANINAWDWILQLDEEELRRVFEEKQEEIKVLIKKLEAVLIDSPPLPSIKKHIQEKQINAFREKGILAFVNSTAFANAVETGFAETKFGTSKLPNEFVKIYEEIFEIFILCQKLEMQSHLLAWFSFAALYDKEYEKILKEQNQLSFDDIKYFIRTKAKDEFWEVMLPIYYRLDAKINHLMLDEFQDTSCDELGILAPIISETISKSEGNVEKSFFCVGDVKQAIYFWRGGDHRVFDATKKKFALEEGEPLKMSYRSSPLIINLINHLFEHISDNKVIASVPQYVNDDRWENQFVQHKVAEKNYVLSGYIQWINHILPPGRKNYDTNFVLDDIAKQVKKLVDRQKDISIGILFRYNSDIQRMSYVLKKAKINAQISEEGKISLYESLAVKLVAAVIKLAIFPDDRSVQYYIYESPALREKYGIKSATDYEAFCKISIEIREKVIEKGFGTTVYDISKEIIAEFLGEVPRLKQLQELAFEQDREGVTSITEFLRLVENEKFEAENKSTVRLMTIHGSKGLEFDVVFLPELEKDIFNNKPIIFANKKTIFANDDERDDYSMSVAKRAFIGKPNLNIGDKKKIDIYDYSEFDEIKKETTVYKQHVLYEALCLLYVAITRAKRAIYFYTINRNVKDDKSIENIKLTFAGILENALDNFNSSEKEIVLEKSDVSFEDDDIMRISWGNKNWGENVKIVDNDVVYSLNNDTLLPSYCNIKNYRACDGEKDNLIEFKNLSIVSPSKLVGECCDNEVAETYKNKKIIDLQNNKRTDKMLFGTLVHFFFEQITWLGNFDVKKRKDELLYEAHEKFNLNNGQTSQLIEQAYNHFEKYLNSENGKKIFSKDYIGTSQNKFNAVVYNEMQIAYLNEAREIVKGKIDRCVMYYADENVETTKPILVEIFDFKTDEINSEQERLDKTDCHQPQLNCYKEAVRQLIQCDCDITTELVFI